MAHFLYFSADDSKKVVTVLAKDLSAPERYHWVFSKNCMVNSLWSYCLPDIGGRNIKKNWWVKKNWNPVFSGVYMLLMVAQNPIIRYIFLNN